MVLEKLDYSLSNHLRRLLIREYFVGRESTFTLFNLHKVQSACAVWNVLTCRVLCKC